MISQLSVSVSLTVHPKRIFGKRKSTCMWPRSPDNGQVITLLHWGQLSLA